MKDTWCPIPWNFQAVRSNGDMRVCCQANITANKGVLRKPDGTPFNAASDSMDDARNSDLIKVIRSNMMNGKWSDECARCRMEEEAGLVSRRSYEHDRWPDISMDSVRPYTADDGTIDAGNLPVTYYDLRFGNFCNLACRMCGPQDSTGWYGDWNQYYDIDWFVDSHGRETMRKENGKWVSDSYGWHSSEEFWRQMDQRTGQLRHVYMAGGEPLLIERHYEFLQGCIDRGHAGNMLIEYNTNMTTIPSRVVEMWGHFKQIQIGASIDGYGKVFEYQRHGASWDKVWRNIQKIDDGLDNVSAWLAYTVTVYNVFHMPDFMRWRLSSSGLRKFNNTVKRPIITHHVAHNPGYLNIRILPKPLKNLVIDRFDEFVSWVDSSGYDDNVKRQAREIRSSIIDYMMAANVHSRQWSEFVEYTRKLDAIRGQDVAEVVPELRPWL